MRHHHGPGDRSCGGPDSGMYGHGFSDSHRHGHGRSWRRFISPEEEGELIEHYISELEKELAGAKARLAEIAKQQS